ncbi:hypothetical protein WA026_000924 [Henosepilachna vigintioctopunctata]|uniref:Uncharacterized protein n=1 Tax=Henosepilachna vigintioctopunctata TaxID=420089 RepID=A0AAW1V9J1_9CUCU
MLATSQLFRRIFKGVCIFDISSPHHCLKQHRPRIEINNIQRQLSLSEKDNSTASGSNVSTSVPHYVLRNQGLAFEVYHRRNESKRVTVANLALTSRVKFRENTSFPGEAHKFEFICAEKNTQRAADREAFASSAPPDTLSRSLHNGPRVQT